MAAEFEAIQLYQPGIEEVEEMMEKLKK